MKYKWYMFLDFPLSYKLIHTVLRRLYYTCHDYLSKLSIHPWMVVLNVPWNIPWYCLLIFEWLCFKEATSVFAYLLKIGWVTHEKIIWKVPQLLLVVLIPETLNMTSGQRFKLLRSGVPRSMYREKLVITVWFIVSSYMLHFCWHRQSCIDSTKSVSHLVVSWQSLVLVSSDIPLSMYMDMSQNEVSFLGPKWLP